MFETAELGVKVGKKEYKTAVATLREELLDAQRELAVSPAAVVILISGVEGSGKSEIVNTLVGWLDARGVETTPLWSLSDEERARPPYWRYWRALPPHGKVGIFLGSWYTRPILDHAMAGSSQAAFNQDLDRIIDFERMLNHENVFLVKPWLHISKKEQKRRLRALEADPETRWRVTKLDWKFHKHYDEFRAASERALSHTGTGEAPWHIVEATDSRYRDLEVGRLLLEALRSGVSRVRAAAAEPRPAPVLPAKAEVNIIDRLDLKKQLSDSAYEKRLPRLQSRLGFMTRKLCDDGRSVIAVFEGPDAAGKGGAIRRITGAVDARLYQVTSVAAPTDEERAHPYLWRFWRHLPRLGRLTIYDRSWYGRVLVERIEGFASPQEWGRAYAEINDFEEQLLEFGIVLVKFWLQISPEEQLRRFHDRRTTPYKQYKLTEEDWRNRKKFDAYTAAACEMIERTSTGAAPWVLVEADDKRWARMRVLESLIERLERV